MGFKDPKLGGLSLEIVEAAVKGISKLTRSTKEMPEATRYLRDSSAADLLCARHLILKTASKPLPENVRN